MILEPGGCIGDLVRSEAIAGISAFVGEIVGVFRNHKNARFYHVRSPDLRVWHRNDADLTILTRRWDQEAPCAAYRYPLRAVQ